MHVPMLYLVGYSCVAVGFFYLFFFAVLPTIRVWQTEVNATADIGQPAMLTCAVDGYPEPMVTWTR